MELSRPAHKINQPQSQSRSEERVTQYVYMSQAGLYEYKPTVMEREWITSA